MDSVSRLKAFDWSVQQNPAINQECDRIRVETGNRIISWAKDPSDQWTKALEDNVLALEFLVEIAALPSTTSTWMNTIISVVLAVDTVLLSTGALHFRLVGVIWKGLGKVAKQRPKSIENADSIYIALSERLKVTVGRTDDERNKITTFFLSQLSKFSNEKVPSRTREGLKIAMDALFSLPESDAKTTCVGILSQDPVFVLNPTPVLVPEVVLNNRIIPVDSNDFKRPSPNTMCAEPSTGLEPTLTSRFANLAHSVDAFCINDILSGDQMELSRLCVLFTGKHGPGFASSLARLSLRLFSANYCERLAGVHNGTTISEIATIIGRIAFALDRNEVLHIVANMGAFQWPFNIADFSRLALLRIAPVSLDLSPLEYLFPISSAPNLAYVQRLLEAKKIDLVGCIMDFFAVWARVSSLNVDNSIDAASCAIKIVPGYATVVLVTALHAIKTPDAFKQLAAKCRLMELPFECLLSILSALSNAPFLAHQPLDRDMSNLIIDLWRRTSEAASQQLAVEFSLECLANICAMTSFSVPVKNLLAPEEHASLVGFLKRQRSSLVPIPSRQRSIRVPTFPTSQPPASPTCREAFHEQLISLKRLCQRLPSSDLVNLENELQNIVQTELSRRNET